jgi:hypothetical protein
MDGSEERLTNAPHVVVTPERLRAEAAQAELRGDWLAASMLVAASDKLISLEAQNQAYRHALASGVNVKIINKNKRLLGRD